MDSNAFVRSCVHGYMHDIFNCPIVFQTLGPSINNVLNCIDKALAERDQNVDKFCNLLDKDITELGKEVKEVKRESQVSNQHSIHNLITMSVFY